MWGRRLRTDRNATDRGAPRIVPETEPELAGTPGPQSNRLSGGHCDDPASTKALERPPGRLHLSIVWLRPAGQMTPHIPRERYERSAGLLRYVALISMNCSASSLPPGSVRSVIGTEQAELVSALRRADAACNVTPIVVRGWIARARLPQPPWTLRQVHELRDLDDVGRRLRGPGAAHGTETRWTQGGNCCLCCKAKANAVSAGYRRRAHKRLPPESGPSLI
jgi:hypothetical protein